MFIAIIIFLIALPGISDEINDLPLSIEFNKQYQGQLYVSDSTDYFIIRNNWLDKTTTISRYNEEEKVNSTILDNSEVLDFEVKGNKYYTVFNSNGKLFYSLLTKDFAIQKIYLIDDIKNEKAKVNILKISDKYVVIAENSELYSFNLKNKTKQRISNNYIDNSFHQKDESSFLYMEEKNNNTYLRKFINNKKQKTLLTFDRAEEYSISYGNNNFVFLFFNNSTQVFKLSNDFSTAENKWLNLRKGIFDIIDSSVVYIEYENENYHLKQSDMQNDLTIDYDFESNIISPLYLKAENDKVIALFKNAIYIFNNDGKILSKFFHPIFEEVTEIDKVYTNKEKIFVSGNGKTLSFFIAQNPYWRFYYFVNTFLKFLIPILLSVLVLVFYVLYRKNKRMYHSVLRLREQDFLFVIDQKGNLKNANSLGMEIIEIDKSVPLGRYFKYYCLSDHTKEILQLFMRAEKSKENVRQQIHIYFNDELREYICTVKVERSTTGTVIGYIVNGIDITEELEQQKLNNWAQLAHDMQTNLSVIKLNAEELPDIDDNYADKKQKIQKQITLLIQKVRDLVTVGRSSSLNKSDYRSSFIANNILNEFDFDIYPNIDLELDVDDFSINCDQLKITRACRNAFENSLKALRENDQGKIKLLIKKDRSNAIISIIDNGKGMSKEVSENMMKPFFTSGQGTGLGTMIIRNAIEQHGGSIEVDSEQGKGTKISFIIPLN